MPRNKLITEFWEEHKQKYEHLEETDVRYAITTFFRYIRNTINSKKWYNIRIKYLGILKPSRSKIKNLLNKDITEDEKQHILDLLEKPY